MKKIFIEDKLFREKVFVIYDCTQKELQKYINTNYDKKFEIEEDKTVVGTVMQFKNNKNEQNWLIYCDTIKKNNLSTLIHELFHLVVRICEFRGVPIIPNIQTREVGDETGAYMLEFYFNEVYKKL